MSPQKTFPLLKATRPTVRRPHCHLKTNRRSLTLAYTQCNAHFRSPLTQACRVSLRYRIVLQAAHKDFYEHSTRALTHSILYTNVVPARQRSVVI